jgi:hypothetical protein
MAGRYAQTLGKAVVTAVTVETLILSVEKLFGALSHVLSSSDAHDVVTSHPATTSTTPKFTPDTSHPSTTNPTPEPTATQTPTGTPRPEATATATPKTIPENTGAKVSATVHKGQGVEHAFIRQIEHNPKLAQELGFKGDVNNAKALHKFAGQQAHKIALENNKANLRISKADKVSYKITGVDDKGKAIIEGGADNKKYEYEYKSVARPKISTTDHLPKSSAQETTATDMAPTAKTRATPEDLLKSNKADAVATKGTQAPDSSTTKIGVTDTKTDSTAEELKLKIEQQIDILEKHPELRGTGFAKKLFAMPDENLLEAYKTNHENIAHLFTGKYYTQWDNMKDVPAHVALKSNYIPEDPMGTYLHKLQEVTGLPPRSGDILERAETTNEYITRALQKAAQMDKLDKVKF